MLVFWGDAAERSRSPSRSRMSPLTGTLAGGIGFVTGDERESLPSRSSMFWLCTTHVYTQRQSFNNSRQWWVSYLVFNVPFQHKYMAIWGTKGQGWRAIPTQHRKASDILTSTLATFLFSSHPKRERDREAHLNYYTSADNAAARMVFGCHNQCSVMFYIGCRCFREYSWRLNSLL